MYASFSCLVFTILLASSHTTQCFVGSSIGSLGTAEDDEALFRRTAAETGDPETVVSKLQAVLFKSFTDWVNKDDEAPEDDTDADYQAGEQELASHLHQVLGVADHLLQAHSGCKAGSRGGAGVRNAGLQGRPAHSAACPAPAPELLHGGASAFLASLLRTYPRGPTSRQDLVAWAATATAFLQDHQTRQRQHRQAAVAAADTAAAALAKAQAEARALDPAAAATATRPAGTGKGPAGGAGPGTQPAVVAASTAAAGAAPASSKPQGQQQQQQHHHQQQHHRRQVQVQMQLEQRHQEGNAAVFERGAATAGGNRRLVVDPRVNPITAAAAASRHAAHLGGPNASAVTPGSVPLVRRVLLAQLLLGWMEGEVRRELPPSPEVTESLAQLLTQLYYIHVDSVVDRAALEYFHISKAGGTSWTAAAKANGCDIPRYKAARTMEFDDECRWVVPAVLMQLGLSQAETARTLVCPRYGIVERRSRMRDCSRRLEHFRRAGLQYTSNEYTLHGGRDDMYDTHICPQFVTVATIREPLDRLVSNLRYMMVQLKRDKSLPGKVFTAAFCNRSAADWEGYAPPVVDNYNIRTLIGELGFHAPLYGIGEAHEAVAKQLLAQFDLVLDLNSGDSAAHLLMRAGLGWNTTLADVHIWTSEKLARKGALDFASCALGDIEPLLERQVYDQRWYSFGRSLARLDQLFLAAAAQLGLRPWPGDWEERGVGPPPEEGFVWEACGLVGLVPPPPLLTEPTDDVASAGTAAAPPAPLAAAQRHRRRRHRRYRRHD